MLDAHSANVAIILRAGAAENKLNRLPSLKDVKLFHPVQLIHLPPPSLPSPFPAPPAVDVYLERCA